MGNQLTSTRTKSGPRAGHPVLPGGPRRTRRTGAGGRPDAREARRAGLDVRPVSVRAQVLVLQPRPWPAVSRQPRSTADVQLPGVRPHFRRVPLHRAPDPRRSVRRTVVCARGRPVRVRRAHRLLRMRSRLSVRGTSNRPQWPPPVWRSSTASLPRRFRARSAEWSGSRRRLKSEAGTSPPPPPPRKRTWNARAGATRRAADRRPPCRLRSRAGGTPPTPSHPRGAPRSARRTVPFPLPPG
jgi:hypothetical protein